MQGVQPAARRPRAREERGPRPLREPRPECGGQGSSRQPDTSGAWLLKTRKPRRRQPARGKPPGTKMAPAAAARFQDGGASRLRSRPASSRLPSGGEHNSRSRAPVALRPGWWSGPPPRAMWLLGWWQVLLWVLGPPVCGQEGECGPGAGAGAGGCGRPATVSPAQRPARRASPGLLPALLPEMSRAQPPRDPGSGSAAGGTAEREPVSGHGQRPRRRLW